MLEKAKSQQLPGPDRDLLLCDKEQTAVASFQEDVKKNSCGDWG